MTVRLPGILCGMLLLACCCGCASMRLPDDDFDARSVEAADPSFQLGMDRLIAPGGTSNDAWRESRDWALLGIKLTRRGQTDVWFVRISTPAGADASSLPSFRLFEVPFNIGPLTRQSLLMAHAGRVCVELFDSAGASMQTTITQVPVEGAGYNLLDLCEELNVEQNRTSDIQPTSKHSEALANLVIAMHRIAGSRSLQPVRDAVKADVLNLPGVMNLVLSGFQVKPSMALRHVSPRMATGETLFNALSEVVQFQFRLAGHPMINGRMVCREPEPPYQLTGGLLLLEAAHPEKPQNRLMVRVLAAKHNER